MSNNRTPQVGEIWKTAYDSTKSALTVWLADGWHWLMSGERCERQERRQLRLLGYTAEYVENLRSDRRPQDVLREAALIVTTHGVGYNSGDCDALADDLDREDAEESDRDRMIERAASIIAYRVEPNDGDRVTEDEMWNEFLTEASRSKYRSYAKALADAGLLVEAVDQ